MTENPYRSPTAIPTERTPHAKIRAPAVCLLVCSLLGVAGMALSMLGWVYLLANPDLMPKTRETGLWSLFYASVGIFVSVVVLVGAISMLRLGPRWLALLGACAALVPIFGPCFFLGIPFGIWALVVLRKPEMIAAFQASATRRV